jgi:hypothetical protein
LVDQPSPTPDVKIYIEPIRTDTFSFEGLQVSTADKVEKNADGLIATWEEKYTDPFMVYSVSGMKKNSSGLTVGMGLDLGANFGGIYKIEFNITFTGTGTFRLYYVNKRTSEISTATITNTSLKNHLTSLINISADLITVTQVNATTKKVSISRVGNGYDDKAYNHKVYAYDISAGLTVTFDPSQEEDRWIENTVEINDSWYYINRVLNNSFGNEPTDDEYWLDQLGLTAAEKTKMKVLLKRSAGCRSKPGYHIYHENKTLLQKLEITSYVSNLRAVYHKLFVEKFYNKQRTTANGTLKNNGNNRTLMHVLSDSRLKTKPNQAELFAMVIVNFNYPGKFPGKITGFIEAINQHSKSKLLALLETPSEIKDRKPKLVSFLTASVINRLYHGFDD